MINFKLIKYEYYLEGYLDQWSPLTEDSVVSFNNLKPNDYEFKVRAYFGEVVSSDEKIFKFSILPPWYLSNFMITNYVLILLISIFLINKASHNYYRLKEEKIIKINQNKLIKRDKKSRLLCLLKTINYKMTLKERIENWLFQQ